MTDSNHGLPAWYELTTGKGNLSAAGDFYGKVLGWETADSGMESFEYHLAKSGADMVAGLSVMPGDDEVPPAWLIYFTVSDADESIAAATAAGASVLQPASDIPGTGRIAILTDPQGAAFGILQPEPSDSEAGMGGGAFNQDKTGHANWNELMTADPEAALTFYFDLLGWTKGDTVDMGEMGNYQLVRHAGTDIGGIMGLGDAPVPNWLPYFGVSGSVTDTISVINAAGGQVINGPMQVPGGAYIATAQNPQGAWFAVIGQSE